MFFPPGEVSPEEVGVHPGVHQDVTRFFCGCLYCFYMPLASKNLGFWVPPYIFVQVRTLSYLIYLLFLFNSSLSIFLILNLPYSFELFTRGCTPQPPACILSLPYLALSDLTLVYLVLFYTVYTMLSILSNLFVFCLCSYLFVFVLFLSVLHGRALPHLTWSFVIAAYPNWKVLAPKCCQKLAKWKVSAPKISKFRSKWQILALKYMRQTVPGENFPAHCVISDLILTCHYLLLLLLVAVVSSGSNSMIWYATGILYKTLKLYPILEVHPT